MKDVIFLGDCLQIMEKIPDNHVDMIFCDLPYGTTRNKWDIIIPFDPLWKQYKRILKPKGVVVLTSQPPFDKVLACSNLEMFRYEWIWEKNKATGYLNAKKMPMKCHENVLVFYSSLPKYNPQMTYGHKPMNAVSRKEYINTGEKRNYNFVKMSKGNPGGSTQRYPRDVLKIPVINNDNPLKIHPTQKPVELMEYFIKTYTDVGDIVLDNCMGSGSTCISCINTDRRYIGIEKDEKYFKYAENWINKEKQNLNKFLKTS